MLDVYYNPGRIAQRGMLVFVLVLDLIENREVPEYCPYMMETTLKL